MFYAKEVQTCVEQDTIKMVHAREFFVILDKYQEIDPTIYKIF